MGTRGTSFYLQPLPTLCWESQRSSRTREQQGVMKLGVICQIDSPYLLTRSSSAWSRLLRSRFRLLSKTSSIWSGQRKRVLFNLMSSSAKHIPLLRAARCVSKRTEGDRRGEQCRGPAVGVTARITQHSPWPGHRKADHVILLVSQTGSSKEGAEVTPQERGAQTGSPVLMASPATP